MLRCSNCNSLILPNSEYCSKCGKPVKNFVPEIPDIEDSKVQREVFYGQVRKCPACGAEVPSMTAYCPQCGHEFSSSTVSKSITEFTNRLEEYDSEINTVGGGWSTWSFWQKVGWVFINYCFVCIPLLIYWLKRRGQNGRLSIQTEREKAAFVKNYVFANDRETIFEALIYIKTQISSIVNGTFNGNSKVWEDIWINKATQLKEKANVLLKDDPEIKKTIDSIFLLDSQFRYRSY